MSKRRGKGEVRRHGLRAPGHRLEITTAGEGRNQAVGSLLCAPQSCLRDQHIGQRGPAFEAETLAENCSLSPHGQA